MTLEAIVEHRVFCYSSASRSPDRDVIMTESKEVAYAFPSLCLSSD